jgi:hypothetical protein
MSRLQLALATILPVATAVIAAGAIAERSDSHAEPAGTQAHEESEGATGEAGEETAGAGERRPAGDEAAHSEELLGVDTESAPLIALAVVAGLGLAAAAASSLGRRSGVLAAIVLVMLVWTALDVREVVHQLDESRTGIAVAAIIAAVLHLTAAVLAGVLAAHARRADVGSPGRAGTMAA